MSATEIDPQKLEAVMGQAVLDMGAAISAPLFVIGDRLGLYKAMAGAGPMLRNALVAGELALATVLPDESWTTTVAPDLANPIASARPRPEAAPVTTATRCRCPPERVSPRSPTKVS